MKKKFKFLTVALAVVTLFSFGGCSNIQDKIEQLRCEHEMNDGEITVQATCEDVGEKLLTCTLCGYEETEEVPATGHTWQKVEAVAPTCIEDGHTDGIKCKTCGEIFLVSVILPALGHTAVTDFGCIPTCTKTGLTDGEHCSVCDKTLTVQEEIPMLNHLYSEGVISRTATCTEAGEMTFICQYGCGDMYTKEIPATGHKTITITGRAATCTEAGLTDGQACETCGVTFLEQEEIPMVACADEDGDGYCDMCNIIMPLPAGTYTEVAAEVGETVVGNWYRIYMQGDYGTSTVCLSSKIMVYGRGDAPDYIKLGYAVGSSFVVTISSYLSNMIKEQNSIMNVYFYEGYADVYFKEGTLTQMDLSIQDILESSDPVTEETTIAAINGTFYRLQVNE